MDRLLIHTCAIVRAATATSYGHTTADWTTPAATTTLVACRWQPKEERNIATGALVSSHLLMLPYDAVPSTLPVHGAETTHRITNIALAESGTLLDAGPFDIVAVKDAGGAGHHLELKLLRAG